MKKVWFLLCVGFLVPFALSAFAPPSPPGTGEIWGYATDPGTGEPVAEILVVIPGRAVGAKTGEEGLFHLADLPLEATRLRLEHPCFHPVTVEVGLDQTFPRRRVVVGMPYDFETEPWSGCDWRLKRGGGG